MCIRDRLASIDELTDNAIAVKNSFNGFVSPEEYNALQARFNQDIKSAGEKLNILSNEKLLLQKSLTDQESKSKMAYDALETKAVSYTHLDVYKRQGLTGIK